MRARIGVLFVFVELADLADASLIFVFVCFTVSRPRPSCSHRRLPRSGCSVAPSSMRGIGFVAARQLDGTTCGGPPGSVSLTL